MRFSALSYGLLASCGQKGALYVPLLRLTRMKFRQATKRSNRPSRIDGVLAFEGQPLDNLAETFGTPSYIYSAQTIASNYHAFEHAFKELDPMICYAVKANANLLSLPNLLRLIGLTSFQEES